MASDSARQRSEVLIRFRLIPFSRILRMAKSVILLCKGCAGERSHWNSGRVEVQQGRRGGSCLKSVRPRLILPHYCRWEFLFGCQAQGQELRHRVHQMREKRKSQSTLARNRHQHSIPRRSSTRRLVERSSRCIATHLFSFLGGLLGSPYSDRSRSIYPRYNP